MSADGLKDNGLPMNLYLMRHGIAVAAGRTIGAK